ncbi:MAG: hypothetical protein ACWA5R_00920 [bacterium]
MKLFLHLHHFDEGIEEDFVLSLLAADGIIPRFEVVGRAKEGNSVAVHIGEFGGNNIEPKILEVLNMLSSETIRELEAMHINVSLRLHVEGVSAYFDPQVLRLAGEKCVQLYVFNPRSA